MSGTISDETVVKVPAREAWKLYSSLQLAKIIQQGLPGFLTKFDVIQGDGGAGTILELFFPPGMRSKSSKEKFTVMDHEKRVKVVEVVEGGYLDLGMKGFRVKFEVIEVAGKEEEECITRCTVEYELKEDAAPAATAAALASIQTFTAVMQLAADYLYQNYNPNN